MQRTNSEYGLPYLAICHILIAVLPENKNFKIFYNNLKFSNHFWFKLNLSFFKAPLYPLPHDLQKPFWRCIPLPSAALPHCTHMKRPTYQSPPPHTAPELLRSSPFPPVRVCGRFGFPCSALTAAGSQYFCFNNAVIMPAVLFLSLSRSQ